MKCVPVLSTMHAVPFEFFARKIVIIVAENPNSASESLADGHLKILGQGHSVFLRSSVVVETSNLH